MYRCVGLVLTVVAMSAAQTLEELNYDYYFNNNVEYSHAVAYYTSEDVEALQSLLSNSGFTYSKEIMPFFHLFSGEAAEDFDVIAVQNQDENLQDFIIDYQLQRSLRSGVSFTANDALFLLQWNLRARAPTSPPPMNVIKVWERGYTGKGVVVAVVDNGIEDTHGDLIDNYNASLSYNYIDYDGNVTHGPGDNGHGTSSAGVIAATKNEHCIVGVAHEATIAAVRFITGDTSTASNEAAALVHRLDTVDIYSCGWGPKDDGEYISDGDRLLTIHTEALKKGITEGRNGKGAIYVWAVGNGYANRDDCNLDGFVNSVYTIGITTLLSDGTRDADAETCAAVMAATYASSIPTIQADNDCLESFTGTSAAASTAAGIIALLLEANGELTWRDVQHIIVESAVSTDLPASSFITNGAGKQVSQIYGFGVMDAEAMVNASLTWTPVEPQLTYYGQSENVFRLVAGIGSVAATYTVRDCPVRSTEHVVIYVEFQASWREFCEIYVISPLGTQSRLFKERKRDSEFSPVLWYFSSLAFWGEDPNGEWTITMNSSSMNNQLYLDTWSLTFSGTSVQGATQAPPSTSTLKTIKIEENDLPIIIGASLGGALGFILLLVSCVFVVKVFVKQMAEDDIETVETIREDVAYNVAYNPHALYSY